MANLTVKRARKILGKVADNIPDEVIEQDIKAAELLKVLFFNQYSKQLKPKSIYNKTNNGKN